MKYFSDPVMYDCVMCGRDTFIQKSSIQGALSGLYIEDEDELGGLKGWECSNDADFPFDSSCDAIVCRKCIRNGENIRGSLSPVNSRSDVERRNEKIERKVEEAKKENNIVIRVEQKGESYDLPGYENQFVYWYCPECYEENCQMSATKQL